MDCWSKARESMLIALRWKRMSWRQCSEKMSSTNRMSMRVSTVMLKRWNRVFCSIWKHFWEKWDYSLLNFILDQKHYYYSLLEDSSWRSFRLGAATQLKMKYLTFVGHNTMIRSSMMYLLPPYSWKHVIMPFHLYNAHFQMAKCHLFLKSQEDHMSTQRLFALIPKPRSAPYKHTKMLIKFMDISAKWVLWTVMATKFTLSTQHISV